VNVFFSLDLKPKPNKMRIKIWLTALLTVPTVVLAVPTSITAATEALGTRLLRRLPAPPPCQRMNPFPSQRQTNVRFDEFVQAFAGPMSNITKAFEYIVSDYIVSFLVPAYKIDIDTH